jgi:hypothetical protein
MPKKKAGKKVKKAVARKSAPRKSNTRRAPSPASAPRAHAVKGAEQEQAPKAPPEYPWNVIVKKGAERLPVTVADEAHYQRLVEEFGANAVEVQS